MAKSTSVVSPLLRLAALGLEIGDNSLASDSIGKVIKLGLEESTATARLLQALLQMKTGQPGKAAKTLSSLPDSLSLVSVLREKAETLVKY